MAIGQLPGDTKGRLGTIAGNLHDAVCGSLDVRLWSAGLGGAVCPSCADQSAGAVSPEALALLAALAGTDLSLVGRGDPPDPRWSTEARGMLIGFTEYHLERRMRSVPMLVRTAR